MSGSKLAKLTEGPVGRRGVTICRKIIGIYAYLKHCEPSYYAH